MKSATGKRSSICKLGLGLFVILVCISCGFTRSTYIEPTKGKVESIDPFPIPSETGRMRRVNEIEVWSDGRPERDIVVIGRILDEGSRGVISRSQRLQDVADLAGSEGADGIVLVFVQDLGCTPNQIGGAVCNDERVYAVFKYEPPE